MLLARIIATVLQAADKEGATALFMQFCHRTVNEEEEIAHKLLGAEFHDQLEALRDLMEKALGAPEVRHVSRCRSCMEQGSSLILSFEAMVPLCIFKDALSYIDIFAFH